MTKAEHDAYLKDKKDMEGWKARANEDAAMTKRERAEHAEAIELRNALESAGIDARGLIAAAALRQKQSAEEDESLSDIEGYDNEEEVAPYLSTVRNNFQKIGKRQKELHGAVSDLIGKSTMTNQLLADMYHNTTVMRFAMDNGLNMKQVGDIVEYATKKGMGKVMKAPDGTPLFIATYHGLEEARKDMRYTRVTDLASKSDPREMADGLASLLGDDWDVSGIKRKAPKLSGGGNEFNADTWDTIQKRGNDMEPDELINLLRSVSGTKT
jgi:hypothetical protein